VCSARSLASGGGGGGGGDRVTNLDVHVVARGRLEERDAVLVRQLLALPLVHGARLLAVALPCRASSRPDDAAREHRGRAHGQTERRARHR
jgi:hypothetical protein